MLEMMWQRAEGTRPGLSLTTLRYLRLLLLRPSSMAESSGFPMVHSSNPYRFIHRCSSDRPNSVLISGENLYSRWKMVEE